MKYPVALEKAEDGYGAFFPDVPGCVSHGDSLDEALIHAKEALEGHFELSAEYGEDLPQPAAIEKHRENPDYSGVIWELVDIDHFSRL